MSKTLKPITTILIILLFLLLPSPVQAQNFSLSIHPPVTHITIKPGKNITHVFTIKNLSSSPQPLITRLIPFTPTDTQGHPELHPEKTPSWLSFFSLANANLKLNQPFIVKPNVSQQLILSVKIPENALLTDHYATLLVTSTAPNLPLTSLSGSLGANILLTVTDQEFPPTRISLTNFVPLTSPLLRLSANSYLFDNLSPISFTAALENSGRFLTKAQGIFKVSQKNQPLHLQAVLPVYVLANSQRQLIASPSGSFVFTPSLLDLGPFTASLNLQCPNASASAQIKLFLFPLKALLSLLTGLIILTSLIHLSKIKKSFT